MPTLVYYFVPYNVFFELKIFKKYSQKYGEIAHIYMVNSIKSGPIQVIFCKNIKWFNPFDTLGSKRYCDGSNDLS